MATSKASRRAMAHESDDRGSLEGSRVADSPNASPSSSAPLSYIQRQMWLHQFLAPDVPIYNEPITIHRHGPLDAEVLRRCLVEIVRRHESWRTRFQLVDGEPQQVVGPPPDDLELPSVDLRPHRSRSREAEAVRIATEHARQLFDVARGPLFRGLLVRLDDDEARLYLTLHHMIFDGVSTYNVLLPELTTLYEAFSHGKPSPLPDLPRQYADFARWQRCEVEGIPREELEYWRRQLAGAPAAIDLPFDHQRPPAQTFRGGMVQCRLSDDLLGRLRALAVRERVTLFVLLLASFQVLLRRYGAQDDIVVATVSGDRKRVEFEPLLGCFLNPLVLRTDVSGNPDFRELLLRTRNVTLDALSHDRLPFEVLVRELAPPRDPSLNPLYQILFSVMPPMPPLAPGWELTQFDLETGAAKFDLYVELDARAKEFLGRFMFNPDLFERSTVERLAGSWRTLLEGIVRDPDRTIWQLPVIDEAERGRSAAVARRARSRPGTSAGAGHEADTIVSRFEAVARERGERLAVSARGGERTYAELNALANCVAHGLDASLPPRSERVALYLTQDARMLEGVLGVLKTGRAYVPLDPAQPPARVAGMLRHSRADALLTCRDHAEAAIELAGREIPSFVVDDLERGDASNLDRSIASSDVAYLLYTSGSTGSPKAAVQVHRNVLHFARVYADALELTERDRLTLVSSYAFDAAVVDMFSALLTGAALHPVDLVQKGFTGLAEVLADAQISVYHSVPTVFRQFDRSLPEGERFPSVRRVVLGGEEVLGSDFEAFHRRFGSDAVFVNLAGQAESSINSLGFTPWNAEAALNRISLGYPVEDTDLILLGPDGRPTELYGEIGVRSRYVALGYWQEPERTAEVFLPGSPDDDARTYRSGDLARALPDGRLEFAGRVDLQTKIAGVRIEPQEIEAHLRRHEGIRDCAVAVRQDSAGERRLVGYLVASERRRAPDEELRGQLRQHLPAYMIPNAFVWLDRLPLTSSNKVDRRALPAPAADTPAVRTAPRDDVERRLAALWEDVLERQPIGIHDEFFDLGGHSLLAVRLFDRIHREFGLRMPLSLLLTGATVEQLATAIRTGHDLPRDDVIPVQPRGRRRPLFVVAGTGSQNLYLRNLANRLGRDQPMYALHQPPANRSVPELARNYLIGLRRIQPKGPYDLVGYSFGGVVAFEIAQQLLAGGDRVGLLALIDSAYPDPSARPARSGARALLRLALKRMWTLRRLGLRTVAASLFAFLQIARAESVATARMRVALQLRAQARGVSEDHVAWVQSDARAFADYRPAPYPGQLTFFWAEESPRDVGDTRLRWKEVALGGFDLRPLPGTHWTAFEEPFVEFTAGALSDALAQVRTGTGARGADG
jgi:amino acid adenylation domain-containing protein